MLCLDEDVNDEHGGSSGRDTNERKLGRRGWLGCGSACMLKVFGEMVDKDCPLS
jgi:hypothetical protein